MVGLIAALGGVLLGFGLLSLLLALFQPLMPGLLVWGNLVAGVLLLVAAAVLGFDSLTDRMRSGGRRRAGAQGANAMLAALLSLVLLGLLAFLSTRYSARFDWTEQRVNTLSDQSLSLLEELAGQPGDLELTAFFREQDQPIIRDLLERYAYASPRLRLRFVDPNQRPDLVEANEIVADELLRGLLLVSRGDDSVKVGQFDEASITNALVKLTRRASRKVYFLEGHNERKIGSGDDSAAAAAGADASTESPAGLAGFARAAAAVRNETHVVESLLLATRGEVPDDADAVILAGPTQPLLPGERDALERYLTRGGALMVMVDPRAQTNLYEDLDRWGVDVGDDVVVDAVMSVNRQPTAPVVEQYAQDPEAEPHPIAAKLARTVFSMARSVQPGEGADLVSLVLTSPTSWAERSIDDWMKTGRAMQDEQDLMGPVSIAVVGRPALPDPAAGGAPDVAARIVVFGDSNFATNELLDVFSNRDLFLNAVNWLVGDVDHIVVRPNVARGSSVSLTGGQLQVIQYLSLFVLPEGIALMGVLAWWLRRRASASST